MSLEQALADNTAAIKELTAALTEGQQAAPKPATTKADKKNETKPAGEKPAEPKQETKPKGPTVDDVRAALKAYAAIEGKPAALEKLKTVGGAETVQDLPEGKYQAVIDSLK